MSTIKVQLVKSMVGQKPGLIKVAKAMGFRNMHQIVELTKNPPVMGMIRKISHMVKVVG